MVAQDDAEAIREAEASFRSKLGQIPPLTGFSVRRIGFRRAGDRITHTKNTAWDKQQSGQTSPTGARPDRLSQACGNRDETPAPRRLLS
jgi:hypothetical protein